MIDVLQFLWPSFLVAVCLVGIHTYFGILVVRTENLNPDVMVMEAA